MSSIYDKASLVLIPSGTKTSKVYSQKPVSGDGDFTFSRSTAATRVNSSGNIEKETQNLLLQSNSFDTTWVSSNTTETGGQSGYDGTSDAWLLQASSTSSSARIAQSISSSGVQTFSIYAKAGTTDWMRINILQSGTNANNYYDISNGLKGASPSSTLITDKIESVGGGWYRISIVVNMTITEVRVQVATADGDESVTSGDNIYIQDAQLNQGLIAQEVITTTTTAVEGGITDNVPRLDYSGGATCPSLLLEPQRTNAITGSEYFDGGNLLDTNLTTAYNTADTLSPEGLYNAAKITATGNFPRYYGFPTIGDNVDVTLSAFAKAGSASVITIRAVAKSGQSAVVNFDLSAGTAELSQYDALTPSFDIIDMGNDWYRCSMTTNTGSGGTAFQTRPISHASGETGGWSGSNYIYAYGAQMEEASYATSYIPTFGSAVTRNVESAVKTLGASYFPTSGISAFVDFDVTHSSVTNFADLYQLAGSSAQLRLETRTNGRIYIQQGNMVTSGDNFNAYNLCPSTAKKICLTFSSTQVKAYVDGVLINTWNGSYTWDFTDLNMAMQSSAAAYNNTMLFPSTLSNQEAIDLTTL